MKTVLLINLHQLLQYKRVLLASVAAVAVQYKSHVNCFVWNKLIQIGRKKSL